MNLVWLALLVAQCVALQVEIAARERPEPVCVRDFVNPDQIVVVNVKSSGYSGDGQRLLLSISDTLGNKFYEKKDIHGSAKATFTTNDASAIDICLSNQYEHGRPRTYLLREIELDVESGSEARDWNAIQAAEKLKPNEVGLRRLLDLMKEISADFDYLRRREERMRDTNESTNSRVKWFSVITILSLIGLGAWQIQYLRHYFKVKHII